MKTTSIPSGAATTAAKVTPGRILSVLVTTAGTGSGNVQITDGVAGIVIGLVPATITLATVQNFGQYGVPAITSIQVVNVLNGPVMTLVYD